MRVLSIIVTVVLTAGCHNIEQGGAVREFGGPDPVKEALFNPLPLRVSTVGSNYYHRPYSQRAQAALDKYGTAKRINYYSIQDIKSSNKIPAPLTDPQINLADVFEFPSDPVKFAQSDNICVYPRRNTAIPQLSSNETICGWDGYMALIIDSRFCQHNSTPNDMITASQLDSVSTRIVYFNTIPLGKGDGNNDGSITNEDLAFFNACYSGSGIIASRNCQACFDYDGDGDVDDSDRTSVMSQMNTGNGFWIASNYPQAKHLVKRGIPLRVGMIGSNTYHLPDCPACQRSKSAYGSAKYLEFYTRSEIMSTKRQPDTVGRPNGCNATLQTWE